MPAVARIGVQHHHAHVVSCAAEHGVTDTFIGVAYDGLGWGDDGTFWGGEVFLADLTSYRRLARFGRAPMPGGAAAVRRPARMALGYIFADGGGRLRQAAAAFLDRLPRREVQTVARMVERRINTPVASSAGRLFDAAAAMLGLCDDASYEGQAAVAMESAATGASGPALPWRLIERDGLLVYDPVSTLEALLDRHRRGQDIPTLAAGFHATVLEVTQAICRDLSRRHGVRTVCLSGGVMQNQRLATSLMTGLAALGLNPLINERVPVNDGGISYGQAAVAAARLGRQVG